MRKLIDEKAAAQFLCCSVAKLQKDRSKGTGVPYIKNSRCVRYDMAVLEQHVKDNTFVSTSQYGDR